MKHETNETATGRLAPWLERIGSPQGFAALAELFPDSAVFAVDADRNVVYWSPGAERLLGFPATEIVGRHCLKGSRCAQCMAGCGIADYGKVNGVTLPMYRADGSIVRMRKWGRAFFDRDGKFAGGIEMLTPEVEPSAPAASPVAPTLPDRDGGIEDFHGLLSRERSMHDVFRLVRNVAQTDAPVLVRGESGTGKELVARAIHVESNRRAAPFLAMNCAAVAPALLESELFGHVRGAFTGAVRDHKGVFERAHGGTLFLDEVAELPLELQAKLLRVLQDMTFFRVGGSEAINVDVRIVSATHRSLRTEAAAGRFRADLMYRLRVVPIFLPPLRERRSDIPVLLNHFIAQLNTRGPRQIERIAPDAMRRLLDYPWPGNIRELKNVLEYAFAVGRTGEITLADLPPEFVQPMAALENGGGGRLPAASVPRITDAVGDEAARMQAALEANRGNVGQAAESLGMSRATFWRKRKKYGL